MPDKHHQCHFELLGFELQQSIGVMMELLELHTCLTVAEKALLWQAPRIGLEANMVLEASIIYTDEDGAKIEWEI